MKTVSLFVCILFTTVSCLAACAQSPGTGVVTGSVFDLSGEAVILGIKITVKGTGIERSGFPNPDNGRYEFEVPVGRYSLTSERNSWFPVKRSEIEIRAKQVVVVNLYPAMRVAAVEARITPSGFKDKFTYVKAPEYETLVSKDDGSKYGVVEFLRKKIVKNGAEYRTAKWSSNSLTVVAERIYYDSKIGNLKAAGKVLVDDAGKRSRRNTYVIRLW